MNRRQTLLFILHPFLAEISRDSRGVLFQLHLAEVGCFAGAQAVPEANTSLVVAQGEAKSGKQSLNAKTSLPIRLHSARNISRLGIEVGTASIRREMDREVQGDTGARLTIRINKPARY